VSLAKPLWMTVLAEGVETAEQRMIVARSGCERIQGFLYSVPLGPSAFAAQARAASAPAVSL